MDTTLQELVELRTKIKLVHKSVLDQVEFGFGDHPKWPLLRSVLMDAFGNRGLTSDINRAINNHIERATMVRR